MPKNTGAGIVIAGFVFLFGFGVVWHMWWLAIFGIAGEFISALVRTFAEDTEYVLSAAEVEAQEKARGRAPALMPL
jgi:cytochrome o ubiquinol oxidase subunit 1